MQTRLEDEIKILQRRIQGLNDDLQRKDLEIGELRRALEPFAKVIPSDLIGGKLSSVWLWEALSNVRAALKGDEP